MNIFHLSAQRFGCRGKGVILFLGGGKTRDLAQKRKKIPGVSAESRFWDFLLSGVMMWIYIYLSLVTLPAKQRRGAEHVLYHCISNFTL